MDAFDDAIQRLQKDLDNLRQLRPQRQRNGNGGGDGGQDGPPPPPPPPRNANLSIAGIEVTQGIQFFNFNGQGTGVAADNSVPLVPNKTMVIRVYVDRRTSPSFPIPSTITGFCWVYKPLPNSLVEITRLDPINAPIVAKAANQINRGNANDTLNFRLDAWRCTGRVAFAITVWDSTHSEGAADWAAFASNVFETPGFPFFQMPFIDHRLPVYGVPIIYRGPGPDGTTPIYLDPPTETEMIQTLEDFIPKVYPISGINFTGFSTPQEFYGDLRVDGSGGCGAGWGALLTMLRNMRSASPSYAGSVFVGLLPFAVPLAGSPAGGGGGGGVAAARRLDSSTLAEEIGHAYGRKHAPTTTPAMPPPPFH
jgi:hypothetical protein